MSPRLVASTLFSLATCASVAAQDTVEMHNARTAMQATVAYNELQVEEAAVPTLTAGPVRAAAPRVSALRLTTNNRADLYAASKQLLSKGTVRNTSPVLYLKGMEGKAEARMVMTRRILVVIKPNQDAKAIARENHVALLHRVAVLDGAYMVEPTDDGVLAPVDATRRLNRDQRIALVEPQLQGSGAPRYVPNDPALPYQWHLDPTVGCSINVREVWDDYHGEGTNIVILDQGMDTSHADLGPNVNFPMCWDFISGDSNPIPLPTATDENHGTWVAGLAAARGDNDTLSSGGKRLGGICGVAYLSRIIAGRILDWTEVIPKTTLLTDSQLYSAMTLCMSTNATTDLAWVTNNSWGVVDTGVVLGGPGTLMTKGLYDGTKIGRAGHGIVYTWAAGNGGWVNPNNRIPDPQIPVAQRVQDCTAFDGYLNRYVVGVAALECQPVPGLPPMHAQYSESGPNLIISAPGGGTAAGLGMVTTDRPGDLGWVPTTNIGPQPNSDFDGNPVITQGFENGDYMSTAASGPSFIYAYGVGTIPTGTGAIARMDAASTSFAAPVVAGAVTLALQARPQLTWRDIQHLFMGRGNDRRVSPQFVPDFRPHWLWGRWRSNTVTGQAYCNWFGFGELDVGRLVYGGDGTKANMTAAIGLTNPGAMSWPLLPPEYPTVITATSAFSPILAPDAGDYPPDQDLVPPPLVVDVYAPVVVPAGSSPARFRVEAVELTVSLYANVNSPAHGGDYGDLSFWLISPSSNVSILGRQRPGAPITNNPSAPWKWTFTEFFHTNETLVDGLWQLQVRDERHNGLEVFIKEVTINIHGYQTYAVPDVTGTTTGSGVANTGSTQTLSLISSGTEVSAGGHLVTTAFWDDGTGIATAVPLAMTRTGSTVAADVPPSLLTALPNCAYLHIGNPAMVVGYTGANDVFETPNTTVVNPVSGGNPNAYFKNGTTPIIVRYSRPPIISPVADQILNAGDVYIPTFTVNDADVDGGIGGPPALPGGGAGTGALETVVVSAISLNQSVVQNSGLTLTSAYPNYILNVASSANGGGVGLIRITATDGSVTSTQTFRVVIKGNASAPACGSGMGLALIGGPLLLWLVGRRRRRA